MLFAHQLMRMCGPIETKMVAGYRTKSLLAKIFSVWLLANCGTHWENQKPEAQFTASEHA
jgi:hypothetical protein